MSVTGFARYSFERITASSLTCPPELLDKIDRSHQSLAVRGLHATIVKYVRNHPEGWKAAYNRFMLEPGFSLVATGSEHTVVTDGTNALKIDRKSQAMNGAEKKRNLHNKLQQFGTVQRYLGEYTLPQTTAIEPTPYRQRAEAVITTQPLVETIVSDLVHQDQEQTLKRLVEQGIKPTKIGEALINFCEQSAILLDNEALGPDIGGRGNLAVDMRGSLVLIDAYPSDDELRNRESPRFDYTTIGEEHADLLRGLYQFGADLQSEIVAA